MSGDLINARELYTVIDNITYINTRALLNPANLPLLFAVTPKITLVPVPLVATKMTHTFTNGTKQLLIKSEKVTNIRYNFSEALFDAGEKSTITSGGVLSLVGLYFTGVSIYFETDIPGATVEILELY